MSITAKELAEKLNLSQTAVSMALNNKPGVSTETRRMVVEAADTLACFSSEEGRLTSTRTSEFYPVPQACLQCGFLLMKTSPGPVHQFECHRNAVAQIANL